MREGETGDLTESRCWEAVAFGTIPISKYPKELYAALFCKGSPAMQSEWHVELLSSACDATRECPRHGAGA